jgi:signal transduction histidine kinase
MTAASPDLTDPVLMTRPPGTFRLSSARLAALYVVIFAAGIASLLTTVYFLTARVLDREVDVVIQAEANGLVDIYRQGGLLQLIGALHRRADNWGRTGAVYLLVNPDGMRIAGNIARWPINVVRNDQWLEFEIDASERGGIVSHPVRARALALPGGPSLLVGTDILERKILASRLRNAMLWCASLCVLLGSAVTYVYSQRVRRRVSSIALTCETIISGNLSQRLAIENTKDEFDELSRTVNHMLDRIQQQTEVLRTTFDSAAHDLRGPLYRARVRIEETLQHEGVAGNARDTMEATLLELERVQRTLGTLLQIAQADGHGRALAVEELDLAELAHEMVDLYQPEAITHGIELSVRAPNPVKLRGNRQLLAQALVNLVENALKYVPPQGHVVIDVQSTPDGIVLSVSDNGPGIPATERERVLQPFIRLERDRATTGSGLGLSLVAAVMRLHRATLELLDNHPGLIVRCRLPIAQA